MDAQEYVEAIKARLASSTVVRQIEIVQEHATLDQGFFRARLTLQNDDFLEVAEFFRVVHGQTQTVEYRYQWMDPNRQTLRRRWDNAPHYPGVANFPYHVHIGASGQVEPGRPLSTVDLMDLIEQELEA